MERGRWREEEVMGTMESTEKEFNSILLCDGNLKEKHLDEKEALGRCCIFSGVSVQHGRKGNWD